MPLSAIQADTPEFDHAGTMPATRLVFVVMEAAGAASIVKSPVFPREYAQ